MKRRVWGLMTAVLCGLALQAMAAETVTVAVKPGDDLAKAVADLCAKRPAGARGELVLEDGVYEFAKTLALTNDDVTVRAKNRGKAIVVGGWHFRGADMRKLTDARVLGRVPEASRDKVVAIDVPPEAWTNGFANLRKAGNQLNRVTPILTVDAEYQHPARWPNDPGRFWITASNVFFVGVHEKLDRQGRPEKNKDGSQKLYTNAVVRTHTGREMKWDLVNSEAYIHGFQGGCAYAMGASPLSPAPAGFEGVDIGCGTWKSCVTRFSFFNLIEEIDRPGEWSYDTLARKIVLYPTAAFRPDSVVAVGRLLTPFLRITGCRNRVEGLVFTAKRGDHAIVIEKGSDNLVAGCRFGGLHAGVRIDGRRNTLLSCDFDWIQTNGATLTGGTAKTLDRAENVVENCTFSNSSCLHWGFYSDAVLVRGCGNTLRHTVMHGSPEHAVDFIGAENTMEYCRIYDVSREYGDSGAVYVNGVGSYGSVMRYNDIGSAPGMANGIYLDDFCCGVTLYGNILRNIGYFGIFLGGGRDLTIENNLITGCWGGIRIDNRGLWWPAWKDRQKFWSHWCKELGLTNGSPFAVAHPRFTKWMEKDGPKMMTGPLDNVYRNNLMVDIPGYSTSFFVCLNKEIPEGRTVFEDNMIVRTKGLKPGAYDLATGDPNKAPTNIHTSASSTFRPIGPGIRLLDGTPENPIDLGFVDFPPATFDTADYMWEQQGWVNDDKLRALREGGLCAKPFVAGDLSLREDARLRDEMPGFKPIPYKKIGLYRDAWRTDPALPEKPADEKGSDAALARIKALAIPNCEITGVQVSKDGIAEIGYVLRPTADSFIRCALALPKPGAWNGGFRGLGNAGAAGNVHMFLAHIGATAGFATVHTDMGTSKGVRSIETVIDFGHRATHLMTTSAKDMTEAYFGEPVKFSVFDGWSTGGGQGFHEAIRYPEDYDGILAGVPAIARVPLHIYFAWNERQAKDAAGKAVFTPEEFEAVRKAAHDLVAPDLPEWARGKMIPDSRWTAAGEKAVLARAKELAPSLDDPDKIARLERMFRGPNIGGRQIHAGVPFGASLKDACDNQWLLDWWLKLSRNGKPRSAVTDEDLLAWEREWGPHLNATSENLDRFFARGGKLIVYGGLADSMVPYPSMIDWYERAARHNPKALAENCRFYLIPGRAHCPGGSVLGLWKDLDLILNWVRKGERPERVMLQTSGLGPMDIAPYPTFPQLPKTCGMH